MSTRLTRRVLQGLREACHRGIAELEANEIHDDPDPEMQEEMGRIESALRWVLHTIAKRDAKETRRIKDAARALAEQHAERLADEADVARSVETMSYQVTVEVDADGRVLW